MTAPNAKPRAGERILNTQRVVESWLAHCDDSREVPTAEIAQLSVEYVALAAQNRELVEALMGLTQVGTLDGNIVVGPRGWEIVQALLAKVRP